ncbi:hypothetical protein K2Q16_00800 [Patescibacteria group bacterium]|nr:hypothetical protein [Patescibacteria group bacterium]
MKRFSEQFHTKAQSVKLKASERAELRERVLSYMEYHPLPESVKRTTKKGERTLLSDPYRTISFGRWQFARLAGVAVCVLALTISYSAEETVPGDALYAVKVRFNEEVRSTLAFSPYEKITWETQRLSRRIAEARELESEGKLTTEVEQEVADAVREHGANARRGIAELKVTDSDEATLASLYLATTLDVQAAAFRGEQEEAAVASDDMFMATMRVNEDAPALSSLIADAVDEARSQTEIPNNDALPAYERLVAHAEIDTTRARELLDSIKSVATPEEIKDIDRRLADVDRTLAAALAQGSGDADGARPLLLDVLSRTQKLVVFMTNIDVRSALSVESLVPVVYTDAERTTAVQDDIGAAKTKVALIETALISTILEPAVSDKVDAALERIVVVVEEAETALAQADLDAAEMLAAEGKAIAFDAAVLMGIDETSVPQIEVPVETGTSSTTTTPSGVVEGASDSATSTGNDTTTTTPPGTASGTPAV